MKKRLLSSILAFSLTVSAFTSVTFAATKDPVKYFDLGIRNSITSELWGIMENSSDDALIEVVIWIKEPKSVKSASERLNSLNNPESLEPMRPEPVISEEEFARRKSLAINDPEALEAESQGRSYSSSELQGSMESESDRLEIIDEITSEIGAATQEAFDEIQAKLLPATISADDLDSGIENASTSTEISNEGGITYVSDFVPIMYAKLNKSQIQAIAEVSSVEYINVFEDMPLEDTLSGALSVAQSTVIKNNYGYTGSGVKIGIIEAAYPSSTYATKVENPNEENDTKSTTHANVTADIIKQAAPGSTRYATIGAKTTQTVHATELLVNKGCKIINMSLGANYSNGVYSEFSKKIDYIVSRYGITFVTTTGNAESVNLPYDETVTDYALAFNPIVVGGYNTNSIAFDVRAYRWDRQEETRYTPDIMAPGTNISAGGVSNYYGSSFAAPIVAASLTQIAQANDTVVTNPALAKAISLASCYRSIPNDDTWGNDWVEGNEAFSQKQGAGRFNALYAADILRGSRCLSWGSSNFPDGYTYEQKVNVTSSDLVLRVALAWTQPTSTDTGSEIEGDLRDFDLHLYGPNGRRVASSNGSFNNAELINYEIAGQTGEYTIKVECYGYGDGPGRLALAWW